MNVEYTCQFWNCDKRIQPNHFLGGQHFNLLLDGFIDVCPNCRRFKHIGWELCLDCNKGHPVSQQTPSKHTVEHSEQWRKADEAASRFFVYILKLDDGSFYVGHTRELRERLSEHRDGKVISTAGRNPKLQFWRILHNRETASLAEVELKKWVDSNPRQIRRMILDFQDLIREVELE